MGKDAPTVKLPSGKVVKMTNGYRGSIAPGVHTLRCIDGWKAMLPWKYINLEEKRPIGKSSVDIFPAKMGVSKSHMTCAVLNGYYFVKDNGAKLGTYIQMGSGKNKRVELHKGMTFSVGRMGFKVSMIEGAAYDNLELKKQLEEEEAEKEKKKAESGKDAKPEVELDSDEEFADDSDDEDGGKSSKKSKKGKAGKLDGPPVMFLTSMDKKLNVKGRIRETSTIGSDKEKNKISIEAEMAKEKSVSAVHSKIILEDGHFYLEDAGSSFGTWVGLPKKKYFEVNVGDKLMLGMARCYVGMRVNPFQPVEGFVNFIVGNNQLTPYDFTLCGFAPIEQRLAVAMDMKKVKEKKDNDRKSTENASLDED